MWTGPKMYHRSQLFKGLNNYGFCGGRENREPREKHSEQGEKQQQSQSTYWHRAGFVPWPHWWEASTLSTAPSILPNAIPMQSSRNRYYVCSRYGWLPIVESLLVGRNVRMINLQNNMGMTPLHLACSNGHDQVVEHLLSEGATIEKYG